MAIFYVLYLASFLQAEDNYVQDGLVRTQYDVYCKFLSSNVVVIIRFWALYSVIFTLLTIAKLFFDFSENLIVLVIVIIALACAARLYINSLILKALPHEKFDINYSEFVAFSKKYDDGEFFKLRCMRLLYHLIYWMLFSWGIGQIFTFNTSLFYCWPIPVLIAIIGLVIMNETLKRCIKGS